MKIIDNDWEFVSEWRDDFLHGSKADQIVRIPHTVQEVPLHYADPESYQKVCGYRKKLEFDPAEKGKRQFLIFDGAAHIATVYFNGKELLTHKNGYTAFQTEITDLIDYDHDNTVVVKLDTTENSSVPPFGNVIDYLTYGGIYRDVKIDTRPQAIITDAFISTPDLNTVNVQMTYDGTDGNEDVLFEVIDENNEIITSQQAKSSDRNIYIPCESVKSWAPEHPSLYTLRITLCGVEKDIQTYSFGFRTITTDENHILLNGEPYFIRGLNRHQCFPYVGYAAPKSMQEEDARILKEELKVNAVRTSHYPQSQYFIDACDRFGLLVFTEIPGWQHLGDEQWKKQCVENTKEMVLQYRNHPSVFLWGVRVNESLDDDALYRATNETARRLDPSRPTSGVRYLEKSSLLEDVYGYNDFSHTGNNSGCKQKKDVVKKEDLKKPLLITEANGHMYPTRSSDRWERRQEHALRHARVLNDAMKDGEHAGVFQWCMFDYQTHKDFGSGDRMCYHGVMDFFRNPKLAASVYASQADEDPVLETGGTMDIGDYDGGHLDTVWVFTNADEVRLYKNNEFVKSFHADERFSAMKHGPVKIDDTIGELLKTQEGLSGKQEELVHEALLSAQKYGLADMPKTDILKLGWCMLRYHMSYEQGVDLYGKYVGGWGGGSTEWKFEAIKDGKVVKTVIRSPRTKLHLEVKASHTEMQEGDTWDMASFRIRELDDLNNLVSYAQDPVQITTTGPVELIGPSCITLEGGMSGTYVRTTGQTGKASITFHSAVTDDVVIPLIIR